MVSLFGLSRVIPYKNKKGRDIDSLRAAFEMLLSNVEVCCDEGLRLGESERWHEIREVVGSATRKSELGRIEDEVDAIFCAYLAWLWVNTPQAMHVYGDYESGYIVTPPAPPLR
jgi:predicted RNase H-like nuclease